jgi:hypothetical protein
MRRNFGMWYDMARRYLGREAEAFDEPGRGYANS